MNGPSESLDRARIQVRPGPATLGPSGDSGLDGVIRQDPLGLDQIYVQAGRTRPGIQSAALRSRASSALARCAGRPRCLYLYEQFHRRGTRLRRPGGRPGRSNDGITLAQLMVTHNVGVQDRETYVIKRVDEDFFEET